jgi:hypothetical protein
MFTTTTVTRPIDDWEAALKDELIGAFNEHQGHEKRMPEVVRLEAYPQGLLDRIFANEVAHPYVLESHLDKNGGPFSSVMGFAYLNNRIAIVSRPNGAKIKRLREDPRWCITYHNNRQRPTELGCITLVGKAKISTDPAMVDEANRILSHKVYRDNDPDVEFRQPMIDSMRDADRVLITLEDVESIYMVTPMVPGLPPGIPTPPIAWRADWAQKQQ